MSKRRIEVVEMLFATQDLYPGPRRGEAIQRDADKAIASQNLPYRVECVRVDMQHLIELPGNPLAVRVVYEEVIDEVS